MQATRVWVFCVFLLATTSAVAQPTFRLVTNGPPGEYVSAGEPRRFTSPSRTYFVDVFDRSSPTGTDFFRLQVTYEAGESFNFSVGTDALNSNLAAGTYLQAQRAPFASPGFSGLELSMLGNGCNRIAGSFVIHSVRLAASQDVENIDVSFTQRCEENGPPLIGRFTYDASGESIPELGPYETAGAVAVTSMSKSSLVLLLLSMAVAGALILASRENNDLIER